MMRATLDIVGMYNYDNTLFDLMLIPEQIDRQTLIDNLLMDCAEREIIYSNYGFLKQAIGSWSRKQLPVWHELYNTTQYDYNPIWNKDGTIIEVETRDLKGTEDVKDYVDRVDNLTDKSIRDTKDKETRDLKDESLDSVYGFNSSTDAPASKNETKATGTDTVEHTGSDTLNHTGRQDVDRTIDRDTTDTGTIKHERTEKGNIGLTSTQDLIQQQRDLVLFNLMDKIIEDFGKKFCLSIY